MKTLMTAALLAAFAVAGFARGDEPTKTPTKAPEKEVTKPAEKKKVTTEELGELLDLMGYAPQPAKNKDGKVIGYYVDLRRSTTKITVYINVSSGGGNLWLDNTLIVFNDKNPATQELLLAFLATHDQLWPAYLVYYPKSKKVQIAMSMDAKDFGPAGLRAKLDGMMDKFEIVRTAYLKVKAAEQEAKSADKGEPNPLP